MNNDKKSKYNLHTILIILFGLLFVVAFDTILWLFGVIDAVSKLFIVTLVALIFVGTIITILSCVGITKKK